MNNIRNNQNHVMFDAMFCNAPAAGGTLAAGAAAVEEDDAAAPGIYQRWQRN